MKPNLANWEAVRQQTDHRGGTVKNRSSKTGKTRQTNRLAEPRKEEGGAQTMINRCIGACPQVACRADSELQKRGVDTGK